LGQESEKKPSESAIESDLGGLTRGLASRGQGKHWASTEDSSWATPVTPENSNHRRACVHGSGATGSVRGSRIKTASNGAPAHGAHRVQ